MQKQIVSDPQGLIKVAVDAKTRQILGASVIGKYATEFVHFLIIALAMHAKIPVDTLDTMVYAFPTYAEGIAGITEYRSFGDEGVDLFNYFAIKSKISLGLNFSPRFSRSLVYRISFSPF